MRLMGLIIAVLLAVTAGILSVSTPHAAASGDRVAPAASVDGYGAHDHAGTVHHHAEASPAGDRVSTRGDCGDPSSGTHGGSDCCSMGACHAVRSLVAPTIQSPCVSAAAIAVIGDEQVEGIVPGGLDRPPRSI
ncbi:hypothetical protein ACFOYU_12460 [Microvirga sp. GCM10011540]|uniref:hypothetical protein n=1 Tax=Microvirga sp. GCM10011540 TaxID=3317338 RepID=UPI0036074D04